MSHPSHVSTLYGSTATSHDASVKQTSPLYLNVNGHVTIATSVDEALDSESEDDGVYQAAEYVQRRMSRRLQLEVKGDGKEAAMESSVMTNTSMETSVTLEDAGELEHGKDTLLCQPVTLVQADAAVVDGYSGPIPRTTLAPPERSESPNLSAARTQNRRSIIWTASAAMIARAKSTLSPNASPRLKAAKHADGGASPVPSPLSSPYLEPSDMRFSTDGGGQSPQAQRAALGTGDPRLYINRMPSPVPPKSETMSNGVGKENGKVHLAVQITRTIRRVFSAGNVRERAKPPTAVLPPSKAGDLAPPVPRVDSKLVTREASSLRREYDASNDSALDSTRVRSGADGNLPGLTVDTASPNVYSSSLLSPLIPQSPPTPQTPMALPEDPVLLRKVLRASNPTTGVSMAGCVDDGDDALWSPTREELEEADEIRKREEFSASYTSAVAKQADIALKLPPKSSKRKESVSKKDTGGSVGSTRWLNRMLRFGANVTPDASNEHEGNVTASLVAAGESKAGVASKPTPQVPIKGILKSPSDSLESDAIKKRHHDQPALDEDAKSNVVRSTRSRAATLAGASLGPSVHPSMYTPPDSPRLLVADAGYGTTISESTLTRTVRADRSHTVSNHATPKRFRFNEQVLVGETFAKGEYDRRADNTLKLTPQLAQQIKQELNEFKVMEMVVHEESRHNTHLLM